MDVLSLYQKLLDSLAAGSIDDLISTAAETLNQHIVVLDTGYKVLASYPKEMIGDRYWDAQQQYGMVPEENLKQIFENKYPDASFKGISYIDWGDVEVPRAVSSVQYKGRAFGHISVYHTDASMSKEDVIQACECLDRILRVYFINSNGLNLSSNAVSSALLSRIFLGQGITAALMSQWQSAVGNTLCGKYLLIAIAGSEVQLDKGSILLGYMRNFHRYVDSAEINGYHYFLFYNIKSHKYVPSLVEHLEVLLTRYRVSAGISTLFDDLSNVRSYMFQARKSLKIGRETAPDAYLHFYSGLISDIMLSYISGALDSINSTHPLLRELQTDDLTAGTRYYETLVTYLNCMCDSAKSAKELDIHRNTLLYRINHIQDYYGVSFSDTELIRALSISAYVCSYKEKHHVCEISQDDQS